MSHFRVKCCCGAEIEAKAWLVREFDLGWWIKSHAGCSEHRKQVRDLQSPPERQPQSAPSGKKA